jgi:hypothetical protein
VGGAAAVAAGRASPFKGRKILSFKEAGAEAEVDERVRRDVLWEAREHSKESAR